MNPEIKQKWLEYLRDGTRKQGTGTLRDNKGDQCCLDVLCEIATEAGVIGEPVQDTYGTFEYKYTDADGDLVEEDVVLPSIVADWAGLNDNDPFVIDEEYSNTAHPISHFNDACRYSFEEIADLIEDQL